MSDTHTDDAVESVSRQASPGEMLRREREAQGLDREEVAAALNLRVAVIEGLEADSYEEVPVAAYRRGYLRSYAHLLGIDERPVLESYKARFASQESEHRITPVQITRPPSRLGAWLFRLVTLLVIAGLIGLTLMWWQSRGGSQPPAPGDTGPVSVDSLDGSTAVTEDTRGETDLPPLPEPDSDLGLVENTSPSDAPAGAPGAAEPAMSTDAAASSAEAPAPDDSVADNNGIANNANNGGAAGEAEPETTAEPAAEATAADRRVLELTFNEQSWTEIFDASNQRVFVGLQEPGTTARVEGEPPFRLTVGNATGVELVWGGKPVDLQARAGANNVARFTLGE
ncbi:MULTISPECIES: RodZ domain-containing protein [Halomonas]|uniref:Xre family transcriptional regulator n=1 Tax=Halomonas ventosae TaxID=229007 RepID=A0A4R6HJ49_9GAMM|nr:RodZ domain-containing protein [Halomonas ventosae]TDO08622.1 Xre family transcriptional regulator [Halomonas ventosae]